MAVTVFSGSGILSLGVHDSEQAALAAAELARALAAGRKSLRPGRSKQEKEIEQVLGRKPLQR